MTSANVLQAPVGNGQLTPAKETAAKTAATAGGRKDLFSSMICNVSSREKQQTADALLPKRSVPETGSMVRERKITSVTAKTPADKITDASERVQETKQDLLQTVAEELNLDENQLEDAMAALGLTAFDLLDPKNLAQLFQQVSGETSQADLLLDGGFMDLMQAVSGVEQELMESMKLTPEEQEAVLKQLQLLEKPKVEDGIQIPAEEASDMTVLAGETAKQTSGGENVTLQEQAPDEPSSALAESGFKAVRQTGETEEQRKEPDEGETGQNRTDAFLLNRNGSRLRQSLEGEPVKTPLQVQTFGEMFESQAVMETGAEHSLSSLRPMELIQQIAEGVRVNLSQENSSMELQLNPENLGKIYLQVTAKEGAVHATIAAQSEAVRAALEAQVADLKDSLNQAGVKVDAVEVTVASHEFEKNLEQNEKRQQEEGRHREEQISRRRNLDMDRLMEEGELLTEEEALAAQIMQDNGNSVDLTA